MLLYMDKELKNKAINKDGEKSEHEKGKGRRRWNKWLLFAFLLPVIIAAITFISEGVYPFGTRGISIIDSYHQYVPFFSELQYKWKHFDSLFYSWHGGLGMNFWAVIAYYLASPLNLLLLIFPKSLVMECFTVIYLLKMGLCGLFFAIFMKERMHTDGPELVAFGSAYALSSYVIGYAWNIMWMDCIMLFPLVMLGLHKLVKDGRPFLYAGSLALCIYTNYYISIMICIFCCLYMTGELIINYMVPVRRRLERVVYFIISSFSAGAFGAVMLLPTLSTLLLSDSADTSFPSSVSFYHDFYEMFTQHFATIAPTDLGGNFNLYCGSAMLVLTGLFIFNKKISFREKCVTIAMAAFVLVSLNTNVLTYVWHGFHFPNGLPGRYSFIYIFLMIYMAARGWCARRSCPVWAGACVAAVLSVGLLICKIKGNVTLEPDYWYINFALMAAYGIILTLMMSGIRQSRYLSWIVITGIVAEACVYGVFGLNCNGTMNREDYYIDQAAVQTLKGWIEEREDAYAFYRTELEQRRGRDDITWQNLPGMSLFSSTVNAGVQHLMYRLGFYSVTNKYSYSGQTPEADMILGIKYLISNRDREGYRRFVQTDWTNGEFLYQSDRALSLGFMVDEEIIGWDYEQSNPFNVINDMLSAMTGEEIVAFDSFAVGEPVSEEVTIYEDSWADWNYNGGGDGTITIHYVSDKDQDMYVYFRAAHCKKVKVEGAPESISTSDEDGHIIHVGKLNTGDEIDFIFELDDEYYSGDIKLIGAVHHDDALDQAYKVLSAEQWQISHFASTKLEGTINCSQDGLMATSIPYDSGWTIRVDGEKVEPEKIADAFIGLKLTRGEHKITMQYRPVGFVPGFVLTLLAVLVLLWMFYMERKKPEFFSGPESYPESEPLENKISVNLDVAEDAVVLSLSEDDLKNTDNTENIAEESDQFEDLSCEDKKQ